MWCKNCQQDLPGIASAGDGKLCCSRCHQPVAASDTAHPSAADDVLQASTPPLGQREGDGWPYDSWDLEERLRHIDRLLNTGPKGNRRLKRLEQQKSFRINAAHGALPKPHRRPVAAPSGEAEPASAASSEGEGLLVAAIWSAVALGVTALACGGLLLGWSLMSGRSELWSLGLPIAVVGQLALLAGLVLQLDRLWHHNRSASAKLHHVDKQIHELKGTTALLGASHSGPATAFYSHFAAGANPQMLLADLKSQLDLLAVKLGADEE